MPCLGLNAGNPDCSAYVLSPPATPIAALVGLTAAQLEAALIDAGLATAATISAAALIPEAAAGALIPGNLGDPNTPEFEASYIAPPAPPPTITVTAESPETPPNWWDLSQGYAPEGIQPTTVGRGGLLTFLGDVLNAALQPGYLGPNDPGAIYADTSDATVGPAGVFDPSSADSPVAGTITVTAPRPHRAAPVVAPQEFAPGPLPELPFSPLPLFGTQPRARVTPVGLTNPLASPITGISPGQAPYLAPLHQRAPATRPRAATPVSTIPLPPGIPPFSFTPTPTVPMTQVTPESALEAAAKQKQCTCKDNKGKKKKQKQQRNVCHSGTYRELKSGLIKHAQRTIPCR
jgi:hypothetical protein